MKPTKLSEKLFNQCVEVHSITPITWSDGDGPLTEVLYRIGWEDPSEVSARLTGLPGELVLKLSEDGLREEDALDLIRNHCYSQGVDGFFVDVAAMEMTKIADDHWSSTGAIIGQIIFAPNLEDVPRLIAALLENAEFIARTRVDPEARHANAT